MTIPTTPAQGRVLSRCLNGPHFHGDISDALRSLSDQVEALTKERDTLKVDAERYRWLSSRTSGHRNGLGAYFGWPGPLTVVATANILTGSVAQHLDAAIDTAIGDKS